jgi:hypothetical protein
MESVFRFMFARPGIPAENTVRVLDRSGVDLAGAADLGCRVRHHLPPLADPAGQPAQRDKTVNISAGKPIAL